MCKKIRKPIHSRNHLLTCHSWPIVIAEKVMIWNKKIVAEQWPSIKRFLSEYSINYSQLPIGKGGGPWKIEHLIEYDAHITSISITLFFLYSARLSFASDFIQNHFLAVQISFHYVRQRIEIKFTFHSERASKPQIIYRNFHFFPVWNYNFASAFLHNNLICFGNWAVKVFLLK